MFTELSESLFSMTPAQTGPYSKLDLAPLILVFPCQHFSLRFFLEVPLTTSGFLDSDVRYFPSGGTVSVTTPILPSLT